MFEKYKIGRYTTMDIERFMDFIAAQDSIKYSYSADGINEYNKMQIVYATTKVDTIVIAGTEAEIEIDISAIKEIRHNPETRVIRLMQNDGELNIYYPSPGDNF